MPDALDAARRLGHHLVPRRRPPRLRARHRPGGRGLHQPRLLPAAARRHGARSWRSGSTPSSGRWWSRTWPSSARWPGLHALTAERVGEAAASRATWTLALLPPAVYARWPTPRRSPWCARSPPPWPRSAAATRWPASWPPRRRSPAPPGSSSCCWSGCSRSGRAPTRPPGCAGRRCAVLPQRRSPSARSWPGWRRARGSALLPFEAQRAWDRGQLGIGLVTTAPGRAARRLGPRRRRHLHRRLARDDPRPRRPRAATSWLLARLWRAEGGLRSPWVAYSAAVLVGAAVERHDHLDGPLRPDGVPAAVAAGRLARPRIRAGRALGGGGRRGGDRAARAPAARCALPDTQRHDHGVVVGEPHPPRQAPPADRRRRAPRAAARRAGDTTSIPRWRIRSMPMPGAGVGAPPSPGRAERGERRVRGRGVEVAGQHGRAAGRRRPHGVGAPGRSPRPPRSGWRALWQWVHPTARARAARRRRSRATTQRAAARGGSAPARPGSGPGAAGPARIPRRGLSRTDRAPPGTTVSRGPTRMHVGVALVRAPEVGVRGPPGRRAGRAGPMSGPVVVHSGRMPVIARDRARCAAVGTSCSAQTSGRPRRDPAGHQAGELAVDVHVDAVLLGPAQPGGARASRPGRAARRGRGRGSRSRIASVRPGIAARFAPCARHRKREDCASCPRPPPSRRFAATASRSPTGPSRSSPTRSSGCSSSPSSCSGSGSALPFLFGATWLAGRLLPHAIPPLSRRDDTE